jgi:hypothetical protein
MSFAELQQSVAKFEAWFNDDKGRTPLLKVGEISFNLLQIKKLTEVIQQPATNDHEKYLYCKQIAIALVSIQDYVEKEKHQPNIKALLGSPEFQALQAAKPFLVKQQQIWYPHYLAKNIQDVLDKHHDINTKNLGERISERINGIRMNNTLDGKQKTAQIVNVITEFSTKTGMTLTLFDNTKTLKTALKEQLEARQGEIQRFILIIIPRKNSS